MGLSEELKIVISGDPSKFNKALDEAQASTRRLQAGLSATATVSGVAFAALTGTITGLVAAFRDQEVQEKKTQQILENTGNVAGMTASQIFEYASALQQTSIYGDEVILESQNILLSMAKLSEDGFKRASQASLNLAAAMGGDLSGASFALGKALADPAQGIAALSRQGVKFTEDQQKMIKALAETGQTAAAQDIILAAMEKRFGGLAAAQAEGTGRTIQLGNALSDIAEELGRALTPAIAKATEAILPFITSLAGNKELIKTSAAILAIGAAVSGAVATFALATLGILKWNAVMKAAQLSSLALSFSIKGLIGATGIGLLLVVITDLALNWDKRTAQMASAFKAFVNLVNSGAAGLNDVLGGFVTGNAARMAEGFAKLKSLGANFAADYNSEMAKRYTEDAANADDANKTKEKAEGDSHGRRLNQNRAFLEAKKKLEEEHEKLMLQQAITDGQYRILVEQENANKLLELKAENRKLQSEADLSDREIVVEQELEFQNRMLEIQNDNRANELNAGRAFQLEKAKQEQAEKKIRLAEEIKYGKDMAAIRAAFRSEEFQAQQSAGAELAQLQTSNNATLKSIGKAFAIADIAIKTAQAAMNIYNGFSTIPIVGPALGVAGAAAAIAFGAERIATVNKARKGGVIRGGTPGMDSTMIYGQPGELVVPTRSYDEVVNAVAADRLAADGRGAGAGAQSMYVEIGFTDDAFRIIERKLNERRYLGV